MSNFFKILIFIVIIIGLLGFYLHQNKIQSLNLPLTQVIQNPLDQQVTSASSTPRLVPNFDHIVILVLENKGFSEIRNNPNAPYLNSLMYENALAANYSGVEHPSLPNYIALLGGSTFGIKSDCDNCFINSQNLLDNIESSHRTWKAYMDSMPESCFVGSDYPYAQKHNPFIYFDNIRNDKNRCLNIVPYDQLSKDLINPLTAPNFIWITPDLCHDMHDCSVSVGDNWLSSNLPGILNSGIFKLQNSLLVVTFDEGENGDERIVTVLIGPKVRQKYVSKTQYNHYSLLKTVETSWGLPPLTTNDQNASLMSEFFNN